MSSSERRDREREALRQAILEAARELLASEGYEKVSMRRIAEKIDYSAAALYLHFRDREALMDALASEGYAALADIMEPLPAEPPVAHLLRIGHAYTEFALMNRPLYGLMFQVGSSAQDRYGDYGARRPSAARAFTLLRDAVRQVAEAQNTPFPAAPTPEGADAATLAAGIFWAHIHGAVSLIVTGHGQPFAARQPQFCRQAVETAVAGLLAYLKSPHADTERITQ